MGEVIIPSNLNDDRLGDAIGKLGVFDYHKLYSNLCMKAIDISIIQRLKEFHVYTTNISLQDSYTEPALGSFDIAFGYPKNKRKNLKQANIGYQLYKTKSFTLIVTFKCEMKTEKFVKEKYLKKEAQRIPPKK